MNGDCNDPRVIDLLRAHLGYGRLGLAFVANLGMDVTLDTLTALTNGRHAKCAKADHRPPIPSRQDLHC